MSGRFLKIVALSVIFLSAACTRPPPQLYVLNPIASPDAPTPPRSAGSRTLAILPVTVPDYLDRREIVARTADHRLQVNDSARWGEGLADGIARVLTVDLGKLLAKDGFVVTSGGHQPKVDAELSLSIDAFERDPDGNAVLAARWMILDERRSSSAAHFQAVYSEPIAAQSGSSDAAADVAALNRDLNRLAADIANSVRQLRRTARNAHGYASLISPASR